VKPSKQTLRHQPELGIYGDCHRTAIACLLDLEPQDVPHFLHDDPGAEVFNRRVQEWLEARGWCEASISFVGEAGLQSVLDYLKATAPGVYFLLGGQSRTGCNHTVIGCNGEIVWDPSITDAGIIGPCTTDGMFWITFLLPLSMRKVAA
jgi:hypothetical protein